MQNKDFSDSNFDGVIKVEVLTVKVSDFAKEVTRLGLTVDRIAGIFLNNHEQEGILIVPYIAGSMNATTKGKAFVVAPNLPALMSWTNVQGKYTFGITNPDEMVNENPLPWLPVLEQVKAIKDKNGRPIKEFYGVGYATKPTVYYLSLPEKLVTHTNPYKLKGISNIRYDFLNEKYFATRLNDQGFGTSIVSFPIKEKEQDFTQFTMVEHWDLVADNIEPAIISFSRINTDDGFTTIFVNHVNNRCNQITIAQVFDLYHVNWDKEIHQPVAIIGATENLFTTAYRYTAKEDLIEVYFEPYNKDNFPFASLSV